MIVSHRNKFIFVHSRKVAGSSMKVDLAPFLGKDDVLIGSWNEVIDSGQPINEHAERVLKTPRAQCFYWAARAKGRSAKDAVNVGIKGYYKWRLSSNPPHPTAKESKSFFMDVWDHYVKFSFVRNPFERLASDYWWRRRVIGKEFTFKKYLELLEGRGKTKGIVHPGGASNWEMIAIDGRLEMDFVGRYEALGEDFSKICERLGIPMYGLPSKKKPKPGTKDYAQLYGPIERRLVSALCAPEIEYFNYGFPY